MPDGAYDTTAPAVLDEAALQARAQGSLATAIHVPATRSDEERMRNPGGAAACDTCARSAGELAARESQQSVPSACAILLPDVPAHKRVLSETGCCDVAGDVDCERCDSLMYHNPSLSDHQRHHCRWRSASRGGRGELSSLAAGQEQRRGALDA